MMASAVYCIGINMMFVWSAKTEGFNSPVSRDCCILPEPAKAYGAFFATYTRRGTRCLEPSVPSEFFLDTKTQSAQKRKINSKSKRRAPSMFNGFRPLAGKRRKLGEEAFLRAQTAPCKHLPKNP